MISVQATKASRMVMVQTTRAAISLLMIMVATTTMNDDDDCYYVGLVVLYLCCFKVLSSFLPMMLWILSKFLLGVFNFGWLK